MCSEQSSDVLSRYCNCPNDVDPKTPSGLAEGDIAIGHLRLDGLFSLDAPYSSAADAAVVETKPFVPSPPAHTYLGLVVFRRNIPKND